MSVSVTLLPVCLETEQKSVAEVGSATSLVAGLAKTKLDKEAKPIIL